MGCECEVWGVSECEVWGVRCQVSGFVGKCVGYDVCRYLLWV